MEGGLNTDLIRMIEDIVDKKKSHQHLEHLTGSTSETAVSSRGPSPKAKISLGEMDYGKY